MGIPEIETEIPRCESCGTLDFFKPNLRGDSSGESQNLLYLVPKSTTKFFSY